MGQMNRGIPSQLKAALQAYLTTGDRSTPISIFATMRAMRGTLPDLDISDDELAEMIAKEVVASGASVVFDSRTAKQS